MSYIVIFYVQLMYDKSGVGVLMRKFVYVNLALWHTYKHACMKLWSTFAPYFMAGLFHTFFPSGIFLKKPSFTLVATQLTILRLAYPDFKDQLKMAINDANCTPVSLIVLRNIHQLCASLIPMVIHEHVRVSSHSNCDRSKIMVSH